MRRSHPIMRAAALLLLLAVASGRVALPSQAGALIAAPHARRLAPAAISLSAGIDLKSAALGTWHRLTDFR